MHRKTFSPGIALSLAVRQAARSLATPGSLAHPMLCSAYSNIDNQCQALLMRNLQRENHYLPACYQRGFADDAGKVWVKEAARPEPEYRKPKNIGKRRNFYIRKVNGVEDDSIERFFGKEVEAGFGLVSQKVKTEGQKINLSGNELGFVVRFIATQVVRTIAYKECVDEQAGKTVDRQTHLNVMCRQVITIMNAWSENLPSIHFLTSLPFVTHRFITGDNPVVVFSAARSLIATPMMSPVQTITKLPDILNNPESQFVITLSPYMAVMLGQQRPNSELVQITALDPTGVLRMNALVQSQSRLFTLARDRESL